MIVLDSSARNPSYVLSVVPGPEQIRCQTYELALSTAGSWALKRRVGVWRTEDGRTFTRVAFTAAAPSPQFEERAAMRNELHDRLLRRVKAEYVEMPGLQLTHEQAQRLCALDRETCAVIFDKLVQGGFLIRGADGRYRRAADGSPHGGAPHSPRTDRAVKYGQSVSRRTDAA